MAKWGEGDPRWIVEERPDATNVNNWHWTERNAGPWSIERIKELFKNASIKTDLVNVVISEVEKCEGEASANNRKGKLIFFYEWDIVLKWQGTLKNGSGKDYTGKIKIPNMSEENEISELDIKISVENDDQEGEKIKDAIQVPGKSLVKEKLSKYITGLKEHFSEGMILPKKEDIKSDVKALSSSFNKVKMNSLVTENVQRVGLKIDTSTIKSTQRFQCKAKEFYDAMTRPEMVTAFTRGQVFLEPIKGGKFNLFGGNITGKFEELIPEKKIIQHWRYKQWPEGHYSVVTLDISEKTDHTEVSLIQTGVPSSEADVTKDNWQRYYWDAMKQSFGFGAFFT